MKDVCRKKKRTLRLRKDEALTLCMVKLLLTGDLYFILLRIQHCYGEEESIGDLRKHKGSVGKP